MMNRMKKPILEVRNLHTCFDTDSGRAMAVDGVDFEVRPGETLGIVGESGSGKSVTALSIMRLIPEPPGRILSGSEILFRNREWREIDLARAGEEEMRRIRGNEIAMIFQEPMTSLNPVFTVGRQIMESLQLHQGLDKADARLKAIELLKLVGIPIPGQRVDDYPHQLSGGMRQRVMIAMALACDPKLLIADEPTTALDVTIQAQILDLLNRLKRELGMSIIFITHDLGVVAEMCDRVIVMYAGQVVEEGPMEQLLLEPSHPYTESLLRSVPTLGVKRDRLAVIPGTVPSPLNWPHGCRFHERCPYAWERCVRQEPPLFDQEAERRSKCWLIEEPERRTGMKETPGGTDGSDGSAKTSGNVDEYQAEEP